jgi:hypothetical protein
VQTDRSDLSELQDEWDRRDIPVSLVVVESPFRDVTGPVLDYVAGIRRESPRDIVSVFIPEYVVTHWWETILHNQSALRLKARLLFMPGVISVSVPLLLGEDEAQHGNQADDLARIYGASPQGPLSGPAQTASVGLAAGAPGGPRKERLPVGE